MIDPTAFSAFTDELEKIAQYKLVMRAKRLFGKVKRMHKKRQYKRTHKKWTYRRPSSGGTR